MVGHCDLAPESGGYSENIHIQIIIKIRNILVCMLFLCQDAQSYPFFRKNLNEDIGRCLKKIIWVDFFMNSSYWLISDCLKTKRY